MRRRSSMACVVVDLRVLDLVVVDIVAVQGGSWLGLAIVSGGCHWVYCWLGLGLLATCGIMDESTINSAGMENDENGRFSQYVSLEKHIRKGDWDAANQVISSNSEVATAKISITGSTALHIAIFEGHTNIVEELVKIMSEEDLKMKDRDDFTVLGYCAIVGNIQMAKCIIGKSRTLLSIGEWKL
ncbi:hypothetical protein CMV_028017 [Castanea mollissima]|uniref:Uncharacterized protein n=1 Tax=Castanea mollissima TaxID=60419 RepID=A0A8J4V283_9ROSI|nr:hypothetical protein CMV_028017 [Castanea mollissima]